MNPIEQRSHKTALTTLRAETEDAVQLLVARLDAHAGLLTEHRGELTGLSVAVGQEQRRRRELDEAIDRLAEDVHGFRKRRFWGRLAWLVRGR